MIQCIIATPIVNPPLAAHIACWQRGAVLVPFPGADPTARKADFSMSQMIRVTLPDGSAREVVRGTTPAQIAADIGPGLAKAALAAKIDGEVRDIMRPLEEDTNLSLVTSRDETDALELFRHDYAHVLAEAVQNLFPGTQITFGPSTGDGLY